MYRIVRRVLVALLGLCAALGLAQARAADPRPDRAALEQRSEAALQEKNRLLERAQREVEAERDTSEQLLPNVLPPTIAGRLKDRETTIADRYSEATILFADLVGFTGLSQRMDADALVLMLIDLLSHRCADRPLRAGEDQDHRRLLHGRRKRAADAARPTRGDRGEGARHGPGARRLQRRDRTVAADPRRHQYRRRRRGG